MLEASLPTQDTVWPAVLQELGPQLHPVDRDATRLWFSFFPLTVHNLVEREGQHRDFLALYQLRGRYRLAEQIHTSHTFLYGHYLWNDVKRSLLEPVSMPPHLPVLIRDVAERTGHPLNLALGIAAIAVMTLRQVGRQALLASPPATANRPAKTPEQVLKERATDLRQGWLKRTITPRIIFREDDEQAWFALQPGQEITTAAEQDKRPHHLADNRCFENMGPIPVECRSGKCGTCWIGILGGNDRLSPLGDWEKKRLAYFGYFDSGFESLETPRPLLRLACQAQVQGSAAIVIPPWCGVPGRGGDKGRSDV